MSFFPSWQTAAGRRFALRLLGVTVLIAGLSGAASIWLAQDRIDRQAKAEGATQPLSPEDSRRYTHDVELYYGETGMLVEKWKRGLQDMTHGKPLADMVGIASLGIAGGLFYMAARGWRRPKPS